jgi:hypothetical protein
LALTIFLRYMLLQPFYLTKSTTVLLLQRLLNAPQGTDAPEEVLEAGALHRECAVINSDASDPQIPDDGGLRGRLEEVREIEFLRDEKVGCDASVDSPSS